MKFVNQQMRFGMDPLLWYYKFVRNFSKCMLVCPYVLPV